MEKKIETKKINSQTVRPRRTFPECLERARLRLELSSRGHIHCSSCLRLLFFSFFHFIYIFFCHFFFFCISHARLLLHFLYFISGETDAGSLDLGAGGADFGNGLRKRERQRKTHETGS